MAKEVAGSWEARQVLPRNESNEPYHYVVDFVSKVVWWFPGSDRGSLDASDTADFEPLATRALGCVPLTTSTKIAVEEGTPCTDILCFLLFIAL